LKNTVHGASIPNANHSANFEVPTDIPVFCHVTLCGSKHFEGSWCLCLQM